ncbi:MAG: pilus assembly protein PilM [Alphaproteobacteria bacterium]|nr:pilus assembly protein PilM [Alphaproteobacteria bacterium]
MIQAFLDWWVEQLTAFIPESVRRVEGAGQGGVLLNADDGSVNASLRRRGGLARIGRFLTDRHGLETLAREVRKASPRRAAIVLAAPPGAALRKALRLPLVARKNLRQVLEMEMEHETPFAPDEVVWDYRIAHQDRASGRMDVDLVLVPRERLAPAADLARQAGLAPDGVEVELDGEARFYIPLQGAPARSRIVGRTGLALAALAALLAVTAAALPFVRLEEALVQTRGDVAALQEKAADAAALREELKRLSRPMAFLARERARVHDPLAVMAAATRAIPNDTYLTEFALRGERVTLVGLSPSAAGLIGVLSAAKPLRDPTFGAPVVRPDGNKLELFTINATLDGTEPR